MIVPPVPRRIQKSTVQSMTPLSLASLKIIATANLIILYVFLKI